MTMETSTATVLGITRWPNLRSAGEAAAALGIDEQRLLDLADAQIAPHWRIDGGPPQFVLSELKDWAIRHLVKVCDGKPIPSKLLIVYEAGTAANPRSVPKAIQELGGLRDVTELLQLRSGIYFLCELGQVVYIGQSVNIGSRISDHRNSKDFDRVFLFPWPRFDLDRLEAALIKVLRPPLNGTFATSEPTDAELELVNSLTTKEAA
jgi:hypothetical protein